MASAGERQILKGDYRKCNFIRAESAPTSTAKCQKTQVAQKYKDQRSASPNISCANDCCGMSWTPGPPTPPVTDHQPGGGVGGGNNNNSMANNNNNNNILQDTSEDNEHRSTKYQNSVTFNESFDSSSESSNSGGFRDPEFQAKQAQAYDSTPPAARSDFPAPPNKINASQYHKSSKQLEHLLAQRIDKEIRLKGGPSSTASTAAATPIATNKRISTHSASMDEVDDSSAMSTMRRQFVQKLQEELKNKSKDIQQKHLIERRLPQEHYKPVCTENELVTLGDLARFIGSI